MSISTERTNMLIDAVAGRFGKLSQVRAVALGGSRRRFSDVDSDIDLYIYIEEAIPLAVRESIVSASGGASRANLGMDFWGASDEWFDAETGLNFDIIYFDVEWMEAQIRRVVEEHQVSMGYTTCFWYTVRNSRIVHDPDGWFGNLQALCQVPYPEALRKNIVYTNHPLLRTVIPSYRHQIQMAAAREDWVSVNHRLAEFFACYFDVLFAVNRLLHPGEKRLVVTADERCERLPVGFADDVEAVLKSAGSDTSMLLSNLDRLLDRLDDLLKTEGFNVDHLHPSPVPVSA